MMFDLDSRPDAGSERIGTIRRGRVSALHSERVRSLEILAVLGLTLWVFWGCLRNPFHFDDSLFLRSPSVTDAADLQSILQPVQTRQIAYLSFLVNYRLGGTNPAG